MYPHENPYEDMAFVPSGEFLMGIPDDEVYIELGHEDKGDAYSSSHPEQRIYLDSFYIDKYPVTNARYYEFVVETNYRRPYSHGYGYEHLIPRQIDEIVSLFFA